MSLLLVLLAGSLVGWWLWNELASPPAEVRSCPGDVAALEPLLRELGRDGAVRGPGCWELGPLALRGRFAGRRVLLSHVARRAGRAVHECVEVVVEPEKLPPGGTVPELAITRETSFSRVSKELGLLREVEIGEPAFDARYLLETLDDGPARRALASASLRAAVDRAFFDLHAERLAFDRKGRVTAELPLLGLGLERLERAIDLLSDAGRLAAGVALRVQLDPGRAMRSARCAFCHDDVTTGQRGLAACERCSAIVHQACWAEHGGCPVLGCGGRAPRSVSEATRRRLR